MYNKNSETGLNIPEITPGRITPAVRKFCRKISIQEPFYIDVTPIPGAEPLDCFETVKRKIMRDGGIIQYGWQIWEWPAIMIEAEFHAIWVSPDNRYVDVTPKQINVTNVLFLPDPVRTYTGQRVDNIRMALADDPLIHEFIKLSNRISELDNEEEPTNQAESFKLAKRAVEIMQILARRKIGRNDPCPCGSGLKYKNCCGRDTREWG